MKKLCDLLNCNIDIDILGIADDSRNVRDGFLFVATKGFYVDHFDYIDDAIKNGAVCVVADRFIDVSVPFFVVDNINEYYISLCERFYDVTSSEFRFIGVTGTDGKTTTTSVVNQILSGVLRSACIGTNGVIIDDKYLPTNNTTPCVSELLESLKVIKSKKCKHVIMEVSSEALLHDRLKNFKYDIVAFTNITEDHLNVHKTIENYRNCKFKLLDLVKDDGYVIVNGDDENCRLIDVNNVYTIGMNDDNYFRIVDVKENNKSVKFTIIVDEKKYRIFSPLLGLYNVYNVGMAFAICYLFGINIDYLIKSIRKLKPVMGRREYINFGQNFDIILDYAHTYNGIKSIIESVSHYKKIITVTGAAGGREKEKRRKIGELVLDKSDVSIFTMDDPRYENVDDIIDQMVGDTKKEYIRIIDRRKAIYKALSMADSDSIVLIIGKGRDNYMAIEDRKEVYCDFDVIYDYFNG